MRYAIMILTLIGVLALPRPTAAMTGNEFLERCSKDGEKWFWCHGFVTGWVQRDKVKEVSAAYPFCFPAGAPYTKLMDVLIKYLKNRPEIRHTHAAVLTFQALMRCDFLRHD